MTDSDVIRHGTDSSGRPIYMTRYMLRVWYAILADPRVKPFAHKIVIVQGAFMARLGGGAAASAGYHDGGGPVDVRTWNLTQTELTTFIRVAREHGFAFWRRDKNPTHGGMDPHAHGVLGSDYALSAGARYQWQQYINGRDGLARNGPDYEWRPSPLITRPPAPKEWDEMATKEELRAVVRDEINAALTAKTIESVDNDGKPTKRSVRGIMKLLDARTRRLVRGGGE